jgi:GNAT superfamily N-acetyltransferase
VLRLFGASARPLNFSVSPRAHSRARMYVLREASADDVPELAALLRAYMRETYQEEWRGTIHGLLGDGFGVHFRTLLAALEAQPVGFVAWEKSYDLHHCLAGSHILDLYIAPEHRFRGIAVQLIWKVSQITHIQGGAYIKGGAVDTGTGSRLYQRFAMAFGNDYILGGKAFRHLATLPDSPVRQLARSMPRRQWNYEP